jgi:hypothetical protein
MADNFPTAEASRKCLSGDCLDVVKWTGSRAVLLGLGMYMLGEDKDLVKRAVAGSLAVQAFVMGWTMLTKHQLRATLPSVDAVEKKDVFGVLSTYTTRSLMVGIGMYLAGIRTNLVRDALAGTALVEIGVIAWHGRS